MKAPLSQNFKSDRNPPVIQSIIGGANNSIPSQQSRRLHNRNLNNTGFVYGQNQDLVQTVGISSTPSNNLNYSQEPHIMSQGDTFRPRVNTQRQGSVHHTSSGQNTLEILRGQRPTTSSNLPQFVMSQEYGSLARRAKHTQSNEELYDSRDMNNMHGGWQSRTSQVLNSYQNNTIEQQRTPYQWPQVNNYTQNNSMQQRLQQRLTSSAGPTSIYKNQVGGNYQRRDSLQSASHLETHQTSTALQQHQMLSSRKLPITEIGTSNLPSPVQEQTKFFTISQNNTTSLDHRGSTQLGTSNKTGVSNSRGGIKMGFDPSTAPHVTKFAVRQDHASPLRMSPNKQLAESGSVQLRRENKNENRKSKEIQLNSNVYSNNNSINNNLYQTMKGSLVGGIGSAGMSTMPYPQTSNNSTLQNLGSAISTIQKQAINQGSDQHHLRTPPVAPQPYDDIDLGGGDLRMRRDSQDFDSMIMKMHAKVKSLEGRYLDLANFYKRELLAHGSTSQQHQPQNNTSLRSKDDFNNHGSAPPESQMGRKGEEQQSHPYDEQIEKGLVSELLKEKKDLELDLQNMIQMRANTDLDDSDLNVEGRVKDQQRRLQALDTLQLTMTDLLNRFQDDFLDFINRNYQTFTENDVLDLFTDLRTKIADLLEQISDVPLYFNANATLKNAITNYQSELQEGMKQVLAEYELNSGYTTQAIKKIAFELQSKHGTAQLDAKKAQISLQSIQKRCNYLLEQVQSSNYLERSPAQSSQQQRMGSQSRMNSIVPQTMSPMNPSNQQRIIQEIQGHVQILTNSIYSISDKLFSSDDDLRYLVNDVEDEHNQLLEKYKQSMDKLISDITQATHNNTQQQSPIGIKTNVSRYRDDLEEINLQLQDDLELAQRELDHIRTDHIHPLNRVVSFGATQRVVLPGPNNEAVQQRLQDLEAENALLQQQIGSLHGDLQEKTLQADRLAQELASCGLSIGGGLGGSIERSRERSRERVNLEQIQFYQKKYDDALRQTKDLVHLTQKFLSSMKRLQRAVHRKEANVSAEKADFEENRKILEGRMKEVKREIDQLINPINYNLGSNNSEHGRIDAQIHRYQNKAPHTFSERDRGTSGSVISGGGLGAAIGASEAAFRLFNNNIRAGSEHRQQLSNSNPYGYEPVEVPQRQRSQGSSGQKSQGVKSREKSPITLAPVIQRASRNKNETRSSQEGVVQRDVQRSSDNAGERSSQKHTASSANKVNTQASASKLGRGESKQDIKSANKTPPKGQLNQSRSGATIHAHDNSASQSKIMRQMDQEYNAQLEAVHDELKRLRGDRDNLLIELQTIQTQHHALQVQTQSDLNKERLNRDQLETELVRMVEDREALALQIQELQVQIEELQQKPFNEEEEKVEDDIQIETINNLQQENQGLKKQLESAQKDQQKLMSQFEDLKSKYQGQLQQLNQRAQGKDLEIGQLRENIKALETQVKNELISRISQIQQEQEYRCQEIDLMMQTKEQELSKLARVIEKRGQGEIQQVSHLKKQIKETEGAISKAIEDKKKLEGQVAQLGKDLISSRSNIDALALSHTQELQALKSDYSARLEQEKLLLTNQIGQTRHEAIQQIREREVQPLQEQVRKTEDKIKEIARTNEQLKTQIQDYSNQIYSLSSSQDQVRVLTAKLQEVTSSETELKSNLQESLSQLQELQDQLQSSESTIQELQQTYETRLSEAASHIQSLQSKLKDSQNLVKSLQQNDKEAQLTSHVEWLQGQITSYLGNIEKLDSQAQEYTREKQDTVAKCEQRVKEALKEAQTMRGELERVQKELESLVQQNGVLDEENQELRQRVQDNEGAISEAEDLVTQVQQENNDLQAQLSTLKAQHTQQLLDTQSDADACIQELRGRLLTVEVEHSEELGELKKTIEDQRKRAAQLEQEYSQTLKEMQGKQERTQKELESVGQKNENIRLQLDKGKQDYQVKANECENLLARLNHLLSEHDGTLNATQTEMIELQTKVSQLERNKNELQGRIDYLLAQNQELAENYQQLEQERDEIMGANEELAEANQQSAQLESQYQEKVRIQEDRLTSFNQELDKFQAEAQKSGARAQSLEIDLQKLKQVNLDLESAATEAHETLTIVQGDLKRLQEAHAFSQAEISRLTQALSDAGFTIETLKGQIQGKQKTESDQILAIQEELALERQRHVSEVATWEKEVQKLTESLASSQAHLASKAQALDEATHTLQTVQSDFQAAEETITKLEDERDQQRQAYDTLQNDLQALSQHAQDLVNQLERMQGTCQELDRRCRQLEREVQGLQEDKGRLVSEIAEVKGEKASLQNQMMELMDQSNIQQSQVTEVLQKQLQQAMDSLQTKSQELSQAIQSLGDLQKAYREQTAALQEVEERAQLAESAFEQQDQELQAKADQLAEMQATHSKNRDLIIMLKEEYKKSSDKAALLDKQLHEKAGLWSQEREKFTSELADKDQGLEDLRSQVKRLKEEFEAKELQHKQAAQVNILEALNNKSEASGAVNSTYVRQIEEEIKAKDELIEEANRYIEEFNDEKHELKAKFKHLMQILEDPDLAPEEESSYKEEDDIDLNQCFETLESHLLRQKKRVDTHMQIIAEENSRMKDELEQKDEEFRVTVEEMKRNQERYEDIQREILKNDQEMRSQIDNARKKLQKYKQLVQDKQREIDDLNTKILAAQEESKEAEFIEEKHNKHQPPRKSDGNAVLETENLLLLQKLQKAEQELQSLRHIQQQVQGGGGRSSNPLGASDNEHLETSFKLDAQRLQQMESQLVNLRRQLFEAKDNVIDTLTEHYGKRFRDLQRTYTQDQVMKAKLSELRGNLEASLNNNIKVVKVVRFRAGQYSNQAGSSDGQWKKLLIVQVISNNECYVLDEDKLSESALGYVKSYIPEALEFDQENEEKSHSQILPQDVKYQREMHKLEEQLKEIRDERMELHQELILYKEKVRNQAAALSMSHSQDMIGNKNEDVPGFTDLKGVELEEENIHLGAENIELRDKLKQLSEKNTLLQQRILELNDVIRDLLESGGQSQALAEGAKILKLREENEQLRQQINSQRHKYQELAKRLGEDEDLDDDIDHNSFLQGIQVAENLAGMTPNQDVDNVFDQSSVLLGVIEDLNQHQQLQHSQQSKPQANPAGNYSEMQQVNEKLQKECDELRQRLQQSVNQQNNGSSVLMGGGGAGQGDPQGTLKHIKGTLLQFLKNCPFTDRNNEELLSIIFSMMEFTPEEKAEVQEQRQIKFKGGPAAARAQSVSSGGGGGVGGTDPGEDEVRKKTSKGIFGMFSRGKSKEPTGAANAGKRTQSDKDDSMTTTPTKPLAPIGRR